jgi:hypothetical protein
VQPHEKLGKLLPKVEAVEWHYDGLNGKIIPWTKENGGHSDDPSVQAFVVGRDGAVFARCPDAKAYNASALADWLEEQIRAYGKKYPRLSLPFEEPEGLTRDGDDVAWDQDARPLLLFIGREERRDDDRLAQKQVKVTRKFEKRAFQHKDLAEAAKGWTLVRLDIADENHALLARKFGVTVAPALLMFLPGEEKPTDLRKIKAASLVYHLKKHAPKTK